ncbi:MAG: adenylyl-sulfate kinase [Acidobacteria bacterium]|nr:adenylyl-sulfate kinase [Acidobacteriota bacterium]
MIWVTGYPASGKTTVARHLERHLRDTNRPIVWLDGEDLRSLLSHRWGYARADRIEISKVYLRLCRHLASQGQTVVLSAVAMYDEVHRWVRAFVPGSTIVYLRVPLDERVRRDAESRQIYAQVGDFAELYDEPSGADLIVDNHGDVSAEDATAQIVAYLGRTAAHRADLGRTEHWDRFYAADAAPITPSTFAQVVASQLPQGQRLVDVGCGNGRDAALFATLGHHVTGIDPSAVAITRCGERFTAPSLTFVRGTLPEQSPEPASHDAVYCRFVLHAMPLDEEVATLKAARALLRPGGRFFIEARSVTDPLARKGEVLSPDERVHDHYRRFLVRTELEARLRADGFHIESSLESRGLSVHGSDDPVLIRITAVAHA